MDETSELEEWQIAANVRRAECRANGTHSPESVVVAQIMSDPPIMGFRCKACNTYGL